VIRSPADLRSIYERKMRERQEFLDRYFVFGDSDYEPPLDYSRTRGLVAEIMLELRAMDEHRQLLADAAATPQLDHKPRPSVGQALRGSDGTDSGEGDDEGGEELIEPTADAPDPPEVAVPEAPEPPPAPDAEE